MSKGMFPDLLRQVPLGRAARLACLTLVLVSLAYQFRFPARLNIGRGDEIYLRGFYSPEQVGDRISRWTGREAEIRFPNPGLALPVVVRIQALAWRYADTVYGAAVSVNGNPAGAIDKAGWREWTIAVDPAALRPDELVVQLHATPLVLSELYPDSSDDRELGIAVGRVEIEPQWSMSAPFSNGVLGLLTIPSPFGILTAMLWVLALDVGAGVLRVRRTSRNLLAVGALWVNGTMIAVFRNGVLESALICIFLFAVILVVDGGFFSRLFEIIQTRTRQIWKQAQVYGIVLEVASFPTLPVFRLGAYVLLLSLLLWYVQLGLRTELVTLGDPAPGGLLGDLNIYVRAVRQAIQGIDPYAIRNFGITYIYPPPALFVIAPFAAISSPLLRDVAYVVLNLVLLFVMLWSIGRRYGYDIQRTWWWYVLALGFAPFLELLHTGQINLITSFGVALLWIFQSALPLVAGFGLALAVGTKVTPLAFFAYLLISRRRDAMAWAMLFLTGAFLLSGIVFGWQVLYTYLDVFRSTLNIFVAGDNSQALVSVLANWNWIPESSWQSAQFWLELYLATLFLVSGILAYRTHEREPFFIVLALGTMVAPNIMFYHHYVFILLPLFVWIAASRLNPLVVAWCVTGLVLIQVDRWYWAHGLAPHLFVHLSILGLVATQARLLIRRGMPHRSALSLSLPVAPE